MTTDRARSKPQQEASKHVLQSFCEHYKARGFPRFFEIEYSSAYTDELPLLKIAAKPEPWTMPAVLSGIELLNDDFVGVDVGEFVAYWDLRELVMPSMKVTLRFTQWMKDYSAQIQWRLAAAALIIRPGIFGYIARGGIKTLTSVVPTSASFCICFSVEEAKAFLDTTVAARAAQPKSTEASTSESCGPRYFLPWAAACLACCGLLAASDLGKLAWLALVMVLAVYVLVGRRPEGLEDASPLSAVSKAKAEQEPAACPRVQEAQEARAEEAASSWSSALLCCSQRGEKGAM